VEDSVEDFVHENGELTRENGGELFEVFAFQVFISLYAFEGLVGNEFVFGPVELGRAFVKDGEVVVGINEFDRLFLDYFLLEVF